jgi:hypothetical protein
MTKEVLKMALEAFESIFASTHPYREDGTSALNDKSIELSNKAIAAIEEVLTQRAWAESMRGVRVEGDTVVITVNGGNDNARELCGALIEEMSKC